jgi:hypothetical protein
MMKHMGKYFEPITDTRRESSKSQSVKPEQEAISFSPQKSGKQAAQKRLELARERFMTAAIAFCEGSISAGQLRAVRELMRERELQLNALSGEQTPAFIEDPEPATTLVDPELNNNVPVKSEPDVKLVIPKDASPEMKQRLQILDQKIARLEHDLQYGRVNASQFRAVRKHYLKQREVVLRLHEKHPSSDRWQVVLEEGKTTYLMQLNEATCYCVGIYDRKNLDRIFVHGEMPTHAEKAMSLLGAFGSSKPGPQSARMFATEADDGSTLLLILGDQTSCLAVFSQTPPAWQVRALREVHKNFEAANKAALARSTKSSLVFPNLANFVREE